ncbi:MAG: superoxide reductase [Candidatus Methanomethylophilaceae archaeon]|nr:superoxide reductase [Candidatus Methanomethylophilaceae archaeon]
MAKFRSVYHCKKCGNYVEVLYEGNGSLSCCGQEMELVEVKSADFALEKHVPYIEKRDGGVLVKVGKETAHPMIPEHYIVHIEICADGMLMRHYLKPGDKPEAFFETDAKVITARELCNVHGVWKSNN